MNARTATRLGTANKGRPSWLAWLVWALSVAIIVADVAFGYLNDHSIALGDVFYPLVLVAFGTVGALITVRRPENSIGRLLGWGTLLISLGGLALDYAVYTLLTAPHSLPGGEWALWLGNWVRSLGFFTLFLLVPLLFPDGRVPSPRWRPAARFVVAALVFFTAVTAFSPTNQSELRLPPLANPLGIAIPPDLYGPLSGLAFLSVGVATLAVAGSVVVRFRRAKGEEREQLKWFAYAAAIAAAVFAVILFGVFVMPPDVMVRVGGTLFSLLLAGFPIAFGIAILKYRLYEIDVLINRTLVYVPLTAMLAGIFAASITLSQKLFVAVTGEQSDAAAVLTTLIVVAAFEPLKKWLQDGVDTRFKSPHDPSMELKPFADVLKARIFVVDPPSLVRRLASETASAFQAEGAQVSLDVPGRASVNYMIGKWEPPAALVVPIAQNGAHVGTLELGARKNGEEYSERDREALGHLASLVAEASVEALSADTHA